MAEPEMSDRERALRDATDVFNGWIEPILSGKRFEMLEIYSEDVELHNFEPSPFPGTYHGVDGLHQWTKDIFGLFEESRLDILETREHGDLMALKLQITGRGKGSGAPGELVWGGLATFRDDKVVRIDSEPTWEEALERMQALGEASR